MINNKSPGAIEVNALSEFETAPTGIEVPDAELDEMGAGKYVLITPFNVPDPSLPGTPQVCAKVVLVSKTNKTERASNK